MVFRRSVAKNGTMVKKLMVQLVAMQAAMTAAGVTVPVNGAASSVQNGRVGVTSNGNGTVEDQSGPPTKKQKQKAKREGALPGWQTVESRRKTPSKTDTTPKDELLQEGWSVPVVATCEKLSHSTPGVCLVSMKEAKEVQWLHADGALAILAPMKVNGYGVVVP